MRPAWLSWLRTCMRDPRSPIELPVELSLGALTGQDTAVLTAIAASWCVYAYDDVAGEAAVAAVRALVRAMQPQCRPFARELIAYALDWSDRARLWPLVSP